MLLRIVIVFFVTTIAPVIWCEEPKPDSDVETIYVVQPKYRKIANRFEIALQAMHRANSLLIGETGANLSAIYHVRENFALELSGGWLFFRSSSATGEQLKLNTNHTAELVRYYQTPWLTAFNLQWSVFTGKALFHHLTLGQFNIYLTLGAGVAGLELRNARFNNEELDLSMPVQFAANFGGGVRFYLTNHFGIRFEIKDYMVPLAVYASDFPAGTVDQNSFYVSHFVMAQLGVSALF